MRPAALLGRGLGALLLAVVARQIGHHVQTGGRLLLQPSWEGEAAAAAGDGCRLSPNGTRLCPDPAAPSDGAATPARTDGAAPHDTDTAPLSSPPSTLVAAETFTAAQLQDAAHRGDVARVQRILVAQPGLVHGADANNWTALHLAARAGASEVAGLLLAAGAGVGARTTAGKTAADIARDQRGPDHPVRELLLRAAGEPVVRAPGTDGAGGTDGTLVAPEDLRDAADRNQVTRVRSYLAALAGAPAAARGDLLNHGDANGWTALHQAARAGGAEVARLLLAAGADAKAQTRGTPRTPLAVALARHGAGHEVVAVLREATLEEEL